MKKRIFVIAIIATALLNNAKAQSWNLAGNAATNPTTQFIGTTDAKDFKVRTNNVARITVKSSGNIGIGTTAPTSALHIQKSVLTDVLIKSSGNGAQLTIDRAGNGWDAVTRYTQQGVPQWKTGLTVNANGTSDYVVRNEITNNDALTIYGSNNSVRLNSDNLYLGTSYTSEIITSGKDLRISAAIPGIGFGTPGNINMALPALWGAAGNVSIGTTNASRAKLVVEGHVGKTNAIFGQGSSGISLVQNWPGIGFNSYVASTVWKSLSSGFGGQITVDPTSGVMYLGTSSNATGADELITGISTQLIFPEGQVGINSVEKSASLDVGPKAGLSATASFWGSNTGFASHFCYGGLNENTYIRGGNTSSNVIIADLNNFVGIGTSTPAYKLDVCGTMRAKEVRVATGWCDYVFADEYQLPALSDVEAFIKANKHLPDVTPGAIIESEGLEVGKTSAQMIKKIEELTLYVIDLQKQVNDLKTNKK